MLRVETGCWYWLEDGMVAYIVEETHLLRGLHFGFDEREMLVVLRGSWLSDGGGGWSPSICWLPASVERIVFPLPSLCPRWFDLVRQEQVYSEEVLFVEG